MGSQVKKEAMRMYSPKIREDLIPRIFHAAREKKIHMTTFVNGILEKALNGGDELEEKSVMATGEEFSLPQEDVRDLG